MDIKTFSRSNLKFSTSSSIEITAGEVGNVGVTLQGVCIEDVRNGETQWFHFMGGGLGAGVGLPGNLTFSEEDYTSVGDRVIEHPFAWNLQFDDLVGAGHVFTIGANTTTGGGVSLFCFGEPLGDYLFAQGYLFTAGVVSGLGIGAGAMCYKGVWYKSN